MREKEWTWVRYDRETKLLFDVRGSEWILSINYFGLLFFTVRWQFKFNYFFQLIFSLSNSCELSINFPIEMFPYFLFNRRVSFQPYMKLEDFTLLYLHSVMHSAQVEIIHSTFFFFVFPFHLLFSISLLFICSYFLVTFFLSINDKYPLLESPSNFLQE